MKRQKAKSKNSEVASGGYTLFDICYLIFAVEQ